MEALMRRKLGILLVLIWVLAAAGVIAGCGFE
jgi:hypothetical protein